MGPEGSGHLWGWLLGSTGIGGLAFLWLRTRIAAKSDSRKEDRSAIDAVTKLVDEVECVSYQYYSVGSDDPKALENSQRIKALVKQVGRKCSLLSRGFNASSIENRIVSLMVLFRQAVTTRLDDAKRMPLVRSDPIYEEISSAGRRLVDELERVFSVSYR